MSYLDTLERRAALVLLDPEDGAALVTARALIAATRAHIAPPLANTDEVRDAATRAEARAWCAIEAEALAECAIEGE